MELDDLKNKYSAVFDLMQKGGVRLDHCHMADGKMYVSGAFANDDVRNSVWNTIKSVDETYSDSIWDFTEDSSIPAPAPEQRTYTVVAGDSLWKIAQHALGNGARFPEIIAANPDKLEDEHSVIHPGDVLNLPNA